MRPGPARFVGWGLFDGVPHGRDTGEGLFQHGRSSRDAAGRSSGWPPQITWAAPEVIRHVDAGAAFLGGPRTGHVGQAPGVGCVDAGAVLRVVPAQATWASTGGSPLCGRRGCGGARGDAVPLPLDSVPRRDSDPGWADVSQVRARLWVHHLLAPLSMWSTTGSRGCWPAGRGAPPDRPVIGRPDVSGLATSCR